jgi:hypothetical protein
MAIDPKKIEKAKQFGKQTSNQEIYKDPSSDWEARINRAKNYSPSLDEITGEVPVLNPNEYNFQVKTDINNQLYRAQRQSGWNQAANSIVGGTLKGLATFVEDISYLGDLQNNFSRLVGNEVESNAIADNMKEIKEIIDKNLPIYKESPDQVFDWDDPGFYWSAIQGIIDSAVGFGLTGLTAVGAVGKGVSALSKAGRASKYLSFLNRSAKAKELITSIGSGFLTNYAEGKMMALELFENSLEEMRPLIATDRLTEKEAREIAGNEANKFQLRNMAFMFSDAFTLFGAYKGLGSIANLLEKQALKSVGKNLLAQAPVEYFEEVGQNVMSQEGAYQAAVKTGTREDDMSIEERIWKFFTAEQTQLEGLMGLFGGPVQYAAVQGPSDIISKKDYRKRYNEQQRVLEENKKYIDHAFENYAMFQELKKKAVNEGKLEIIDLINDAEFTTVTIKNFMAGTYVGKSSTSMGLIDQIEEIRNFPEEEAKKRGYPENYKQIASDQIAQLEAMKTDWLRASKYVNQQDVFLHRQAMNMAERRVNKLSGELNESYQRLEKRLQKLPTSSELELFPMLSTLTLDFLDENKQSKDERLNKIKSRLRRGYKSTTAYKEYIGLKEKYDKATKRLNDYEEKMADLTSTETQKKYVKEAKEKAVAEDKKKRDAQKKQDVKSTVAEKEFKIDRDKKKVDEVGQEMNQTMANEDLSEMEKLENLRRERAKLEQLEDAYRDDNTEEAKEQKFIDRKNEIDNEIANIQAQMQQEAKKREQIRKKREEKPSIMYFNPFTAEIEKFEGNPGLTLLASEKQALDAYRAWLKGETDNVSPTIKAAFYRKYNITKPDGTPITEEDILGNPVQYQKPYINDNLKETELGIRDLAARLVDRIGGEVKFESDLTKDYSGYSQGNTFVINLAKATLDTPIHEILGHPIIRAIRDKNNVANITNYSKGSVEENLEQEFSKKLREKVIVEKQQDGNNVKYVIKNSKGEVVAELSGTYDSKGLKVKGIEVNEKYRRKGLAKTFYLTIGKTLLRQNKGTIYSRSAQHQFTAKDKQGRSIAPANKLWESLVKEGKAKKTPKVVEHEYEIIDNGEIDENSSTNNLYQNLLKELETGKGKEVLDRVKRDYNKKLIKGTQKDLYNLQGWEDRLRKDPNDEIAKTWRDEVAKKIEYGKYTLEEQQEEALVQLLGELTAGKIKETKENKNLISLLKKLLKEMTEYMRSLFTSKEIEIDKLSSDITLNDLANLLAYTNSKILLPGSKVEYRTPDDKKFSTYQEASNHISELIKLDEVDLSNINLKEFNETKLPNSFYHEIDNVGIFNKDGKWYEQFSGEEPSEITLDDAKEYYISSQLGDSKTFEDFYKYKDGIENFIDKNKQYEQSKEIIEAWKEENNIQYNPEEVYSRGQGFYSAIGAYSTVELDLLLQNLLQHIEDNKKAGGEFTISAFTAPVGKTLKHLGGESQVRFVIYPKSKDIKWAAPTDVYSGSVWDASEKVSKNKKSELLGVSHTKAPSLVNVDKISPNLADIIDKRSHHHNELGIELTPINFRLEYDDSVPYKIKKLVDSVNSILDQKYGKLVKPEVNQNFTKVQPTQTEKNTTSIENVKSKLSTLNYFIKEENGKFPIYSQDPNSGEYNIEDLFDTKKEAEKALEKYNTKASKKEYNSQALINTKIAKLKEVAKKYPRSLISSEIVNTYEIGLQFQKSLNSAKEELKNRIAEDKQRQWILEQFNQGNLKDTDFLTDSFTGEENAYENVKKIAQGVDMMYTPDNEDIVNEFEKAEEREYDPRLNQAFNVLAYLSRNYGEESLNEEGINHNILDYNKIKPGTNITIAVDNNYDGLVTYKGQKVKWSEIAVGLSEEERIDLVPITVSNSEGVFAYLHDPNWITEERVKTHVASISDQRDILRAIRKAVLEKGSVKSKITNRTLGKFFKSDELMDVEAAFPDPGLKFGIANGDAIERKFQEGDAYNVPVKNIVRRVRAKTNGGVFGLIPTGNGDEHLVVPFSNAKISDEVATAMKEAILLHMRSKYGQATDADYANAEQISKLIDIRDEQGEKLNYDITTQTGLNNYLKLYIPLVGMNNDVPLSDLAKQYKSNVKLIQVNPNGVDFAIGKGKAIIGPNFEENQHRYEKMLDEHLKGMYGNVTHDGLGQKISMPVIVQGKVISINEKGRTYDDYVKRNVLRTNLRQFNIYEGQDRKPFYVSFIQPIVEFDISFATTPEMKKEAYETDMSDTNTAQLVSEEVAQLIKDIKAAHDAEGNIKEGRVSDVYILTQRVLGLNEKISTVSEKQIESLKTLSANAELALLEAGMEVPSVDTTLPKPPTKEEQKTIAVEKRIGKKYKGNTLKLPTKKNKKYESPLAVSDEQAKDIDNPFRIKGISVDEQSELVTSLAHIISRAIDDNPGKSKRAVIKEELDLLHNHFSHPDYGEVGKSLISQWSKVKRLVNAKLSFFNANINLEEIESDSYVEEASFYGEEAYDTNILERNQMEKISAELKKFLSFIQDSTKEGVISDHPYIPFEEAYVVVKAAVTGLPKDINQMLDALRQLKNSIPYMRDIIEAIENAPEHIKNEFVIAMSSHYVSMKHILYQIDKLGYDAVVADDNANTRTRIIKALWNENFMESGLVADTPDETGDYPIFKENADDLVEDFDRMVQVDNPGKENWVGWLAWMGIEIDQSILNRLMVDGLNVGKVTLKGNNIFTASNSPFRVIRNNLAGISENETAGTTRIMEDSAIAKLAANVARYDTSILTHSHKSGDKTIYSYTVNKFAADRTRELQTDKELLTYLTKSPFARHSFWLKNLVKWEAGKGYQYDENGMAILNNNNFTQNFEMFYTSHNILNRKFGFNIQKELTNLTPLEHEMVKLNMFINKNEYNGRNRIAHFFDMTLSDKKTMVGFKARPVQISLDKNGNVTDEVVNKLIEFLVRPEFERMQVYKRLILNDRKPNIKGYEAGQELFYLIPSLNDTPEFFTENGVIKEDILDIDSDNYKILRQKVSDFANKEVDAKVETFGRLGIINNRGISGVDNKYLNSISGTVNEKVRILAADFGLNSIIANANIMQLYSGDPALYFKAAEKPNPTKQDNVFSTFENLGKRLAGEIAPGVDLADSENNVYRQVFVKDWVVSSSILAELDKILSKEDIEAYKKIEATDAQEFTTLSEHLYVMYKMGKLTEKDYNTLRALAKKGADIPEDMLKVVLQPLKPVYTYNVPDPATGSERKVYIKSSSIPLIPQMTRGLELDKIRKMMEKQGVARLAFDTAVKVGNVTNSVKLFNQDGIVNENVNLKSPETSMMLPRKGFRIQQEIPVKEDNLISAVTQARKNLFTDILNLKGFKYHGNIKTAKQLYEEYQTKYKFLFRHAMELALDELGTSYDEAIVDDNKLRQILYSEAEKRGYSFPEIESLEIGKDGRFVKPIWSNLSSKHESLLNSLINNKVVKQKMPGRSYVLVTEAGFKQSNPEAETGIVYTDAWERELKPNQIILPWRFKGKLSKFIGKDGKLDTSKIDPDLLKMIGMRIPHQGPNSTMVLEVVGFLPPSCGDIAIASRDIVAQMDSDYDVDKLYVYSHHHAYDEGKIYKAAQTDIEQAQNDIVDIHISIGENAEVQKIQKKPLGFGKFKQLANELEAVKKIIYNSYISSDYQRDKYINAKVGKSAVGIYASAGNFNSMSQVLHNTPDALIINLGENNITIGNESSSGYLSSPVDVGGNSISENISALLSLAVDNEKEQALHKLNLNDHTFGISVAMLQLGFTQETIAYFLSQPAVMRFVEAANETNKKTALADIKVSPDKIDGSILTKKAMKEIINGEKEETPDFADATNALILQLDRVASELLKVSSTINTESKGIPSTMMESNNKQERLEDLPHSIIQNAEELIGDYVSGHEIENVEDRNLYFRVGSVYIKPTTVLGYASVFGLAANNKIWNASTEENVPKYYPYKLKSVKDAVAEIYRNADGDFTDAFRKVLIDRKIFGDMKSFVYSDGLLFLEEGQTANELREKYFYDTEENDSLATIISKLRNSEAFKVNPFLNSLRTEKKPNRPHMFHVRPKFDNADMDLILYSNLTDLIRNPISLGEFNGQGYNSRQFIGDLVRAEHLAGGTRVFGSILKYVPLSYYEILGINEKLNNYNWAPVFSPGRNGKMSPFALQFMQHHSYLVPEYGLEDVIVSQEGDKAVIPETSSAIKHFKGGGVRYPGIIKVNNSLYTHVGGGKYINVPRLGSANYKEYDMSQQGPVQQSVKKTEPPASTELPLTDEGIPIITSDEEKFDANKDYQSLFENILPAYNLTSGITIPKNQIGDVLVNMAMETSDPFHKAIFDFLIKLEAEGKLNVDRLKIGTKEKNYGSYDVFDDGSTEVKISIYNPSPYQFEKTMIHEFVHAVTMDGIKNPQTKQQREAVKSLDNIRKQIIKAYEINETKIEELKFGKGITSENKILYALSSVEEFVAFAMMSRDFQNVINVNVKGEKKTLLQKFLDAIKSLLEPLGFSFESGMAKVMNDIILLTDNSNGGAKTEVSHQMPIIFGDVNEKYRKLIEENEKYIGSLYKRLSVARGKYAEAKTKSDRVYYTNRIKRIENEIEAAKDKGASFPEIQALEDLSTYAESDIEYISEKINKKPDDIDFAEIFTLQKKIDLWANVEANFFSEQEKESEILRYGNEGFKGFNYYRNKAEDYQDTLNKIKQFKVLQFVNQQFDGDYANIFDPTKDISSYKSMLLDLSKSDHVILQAVDKAIGDAQAETDFELASIARDIEPIVKAAEQALKDSNLSWDAFMQQYEDGRYTGRLVLPFQQEFYDKRQKMLDQANRINTSEAWTAYRKWVADNVKVLDHNLILGDSEEAKNYQAKIIELIGQDEFEHKKDRIKQKIDNYQLDREVYKELLEQDGYTGDEKERLMSEWDMKNSPEYYMRYIKGESFKVGNKYVKMEGYKYTESIPADKWRDKKFDTIRKNKALQDLHRKYMELFSDLRKFLPSDTKKQLYINTIPFMERHFIDMLVEGHMSKAGREKINSFIKDLRSDDMRTVIYADEDSDGRTLSDRFRRINSEQIKSFVKVKTLEYKLENGHKPSVAEINEFRKQAEDELAQRGEFNMGRIMANYAAMAVTFKHRARIEDALKLTEEVFNNIEELRTNAAGALLRKKGKENAPLSEEGLKNAKAQLSHQLDLFFGNPRKKSKLANEKIYTKEEKEVAKRIETLIEKLTVEKEEIEKKIEKKSEKANVQKLVNKKIEIENDINQLQNELDAIGGVVTQEGVANLIQQGIQLKGMGWNVFAGFTNIGFGTISNWIEAAGGEFYSQKQLAKAYKLVFHAVGRNASFNSVTTETAAKIRALMDMWNVLKSSSEELFNNRLKTGNRLLDVLTPYNITARTEYINQAPVMIAVMLNTEVKGPNGETSNLWEATDKDGNIKEGYEISKKDLLTAKSNIDKAIRHNHGNYDPIRQQRLKRTILGRLVAQFRTWALEGFANRFEDAYTDHERKLIRKGRYRSYGGGSLAMAGLGLGTIIMPGIGTAIGTGIGLLAGKFIKSEGRYKEGQEMGNFEELFFTTKQLLRKLAGKKTKFDDKFTTIDAANLRRNLAEITILLGISAVGMLLKHMATEGPGDDDENKRLALNYAINVFFRLQQDIRFYSDPISFEQLSRNAVPVMSTIIDAQQLIKAGARALQGDDLIETGVYAGESRLERETYQFFPLTSQIAKTVSISRTLYER